MPTVADLYIDGEILPENYIWPEEQATSLYRVRKQVEAYAQFDRVRLNIFSPGGYCLEGWAIYDYLIGLGVPVDSFAYGQCASIATVFSTMGEKREISPNCEYVVHRPWGGVWGNDIQIDKYNAMLKAENTRLFNHYSARTGLSVDMLSSFIGEEDVYLTPQETVDKNFSTGIYQPAAAVQARFAAHLHNRKPVYLLSLNERRINPNAPKDSTVIKTNLMSDKKKSLLDAAKSVLAFLGGEDPKALDVTLKDGSVLVTNSTGDTPVVGDTATLKTTGEAAPDGDYLTESGLTLTVTGGVITAVTETVEDSTSADVEALKKENQELKDKFKALEDKHEGFVQRVTPVLSSLISQEPNTNSDTQPRSKGKATDAQSDRAKMLAEHVASFAKK